MKNLEKATFAAGCFWGVEELFRNVRGVKKTRVGYIGGWKHAPKYEEVCSGTTGHAEAVEILYDPQQIEYGELLSFFLKAHLLKEPNDRKNASPTDQYRSAIFFHNTAQKEKAQKFLKEIAQKNKDEAACIFIAPASKFWQAEEYHQQYIKKNKASSCHI